MPIPIHQDHQVAGTVEESQGHARLLGIMAVESEVNVGGHSARMVDAHHPLHDEGGLVLIAEGKRCVPEDVAYLCHGPWGNSRQVLVCWCVGMLVYWYIGMLVYWYIGILVYWCVGILVYWYVGILVYWCVGILVYWCVGILVYWCVGILVYWCVGILVCWCVGILG